MMPGGGGTWPAPFTVGSPKRSTTTAASSSSTQSLPEMLRRVLVVPGDVPNQLLKGLDCWAAKKKAPCGDGPHVRVSCVSPQKSARPTN